MTMNPVTPRSFFAKSFADSDPEVYACVKDEWERQSDGIELIASENIVSLPVMRAMASVFTNKYAEGYPGKRYYGGCFAADAMEEIAIARAKKIFGCQYANVQPHSGSQANQAVFMATLNPGDAFLGMSLNAGGHLTHGSGVNLSGKWFQPIAYGITENTHRIDYDQVEDLAMKHRPKLIIAGSSSYSRAIDYKKFREIADRSGSLLLADMAHVAGLVAAGLHPSPIPHAHFVTTTTHKTLRCGRGGMILTNEPEYAKLAKAAVFPGLQGGPLLPMLVSKAVGFGEVLKPDFRTYIAQVIKNANVLAETLVASGLSVVSGGTDNHMLLVDLRPHTTGNVAEEALEQSGITCNKNAVPNETEKPTITSGVRLGTPAATTRGFGEEEFRVVGDLISTVIDALAKGKLDSDLSRDVQQRVRVLCQQFPLYALESIQ